ncbi:MAG: hypothetical protein K8S24_05520 [Candidatus Aegiribacteria sp.]|nr:hypothetical protein [Candidatus Aegiribacteria sp.]
MILCCLILCLNTYVGTGEWCSEITAIAPCSVIVQSPTHESISWQLLIPVRASYDNMLSGIGPVGLGVDTLLYIAVPFADYSEEALLVSGENGVPELGTFYLAAGLETRDTLHLVNPPHTSLTDVVQISLRPNDTYIGYLYELINTPFLMAPRRTPDGSHQSDSRLGTDCAGLAVYGKRRQGFDYSYLGAQRISEYLIPIGEGSYEPVASSDIAIFKNDENSVVPVGDDGLQPGDILHFGAQVSVFLEDRGITGILDSQDMVIQSWFSGPHVCTIKENGFFGLPVKLYRWPQ